MTHQCQRKSAGSSSSNKLGEGGMGIVYRGFDTLMQRHVAIKTLRLDPDVDPQLKERLLREAVAASTTCVFRGIVNADSSRR